MLERPESIRTDLTNAFAHNTVAVRLPTIARETAQLNPDYPAEIADRLEALAHELESDAPIPAIADPGWQPLIEAHRGETWLHTQWFFAETYFYRLLIDAVHWYETRRDPFAPKKVEEIAGDAMRNALFVAFEMTPVSLEDQIADRMLRSVWGNRIDLSFSASLRHGMHGAEDDLIADERAAAIEHLKRHRGGEVHLIADNTGTELAMDWLLIDTLLDSEEGGESFADRITLHVKEHPTFVSDATRDDALTLLAELGGRGSIARGFGTNASAAAERLQAALLDDRLNVREDGYWNSGILMIDAPERIRRMFEDASLVITKGDANYRRFSLDVFWDAALPFQQMTSYFPAPLLAMRTLKSDTLAGLQPGQAEALDEADPLWRVNGRRAVAQFGGRIG